MLYNLNGQYSEAFSFGAENRLFKYGDGLFESILVLNGQVFNLSHHHRRLKYSMELLHLRLNIDLLDLFAEVEQLFERNNRTNGFMRLTVFRKDGGMYSPYSNDCNYFMTIQDVDVDPFFKLNNFGLKLGTYDEHYKNRNLLSNIKSSNSLLYVLAAIEKSKSEFDDLILFNDLQQPIETCNSNIFIVNNNICSTPPLSSGALDGTMRALVMDNIEVEEREIDIQELNSCDEIFLTNALGLKWVEKFLARGSLSNKLSSELIHSLNQLI